LLVKRTVWFSQRTARSVMYKKSTLKVFFVLLVLVKGFRQTGEPIFTGANRKPINICPDNGSRFYRR
jgi:hypothetical protein